MWIPNGWNASYGPRSSTYYQMVYGGFNRVGMESLAGLSLRNMTRRRGRSLTVVWVLACGVFLVVAVEEIILGLVPSSRVHN